jgi:cytochrome c5
VLTATALKGIRNMPAHGGNPGLSDIEVERAITYIVNRSGGHWVEPMGGAGPAVVRSGEQLVQTQCAKCHQDGLNGAPRIGDRAAWAPRLAKGLPAVVKTALHGHGGMPARGGLAQATDAEIQGAIVYMFNYGVPEPPPPAPAAVADPYHQVIDGIEVYLGIVRAGADSANRGTTPPPTGVLPPERLAVRRGDQGGDHRCACEGPGQRSDEHGVQDTGTHRGRRRGELRRLLPHARSRAVHDQRPDRTPGHGPRQRGDVRLPGLVGRGRPSGRASPAAGALA